MYTKLGTYKLRDKKGRFASFKRNFFWFAKTTLTGIFILLLGMSLWVGGEMNGEGKSAVKTVKAEEKVSSKVEGLKDAVVESISKCERSIYDADDAPIILDTNKVMSIGILMFQKKTVMHYYSKLYGKKITAREATLIALDEVQARKMAKDIIFKEKDGWKNWFNCGVKYGIGAQVELVNKLK